MCSPCSDLHFLSCCEYASSITVIVSIVASSVNESPIWLGKCFSGKQGEKMNRSNAECRQILRNGKPPDLRNKSLLMSLSILSKTVSHGVVKGGGQDF